MPADRLFGHSPFFMTKAIFVLFSFCLFACTLTVETDFAANWSGKIRFSVNYSQMKALLSSIDTLDVGLQNQFLSDEEIESIKTELQLIKGISDVKVISDPSEHIIIVSARYDGIESLNQMFKELVIEKFEQKQDAKLLYSAEHNFFDLQGRHTLVYRHKKLQGLDNVHSELVLGFTGRIRKVSSQHVILSNDRRKATVLLDSLRSGESVIFKL